MGMNQTVEKDPVGTIIIAQMTKYDIEVTPVKLGTERQV
jgi:hypothetical protein